MKRYFVFISAILLLIISSSSIRAVETTDTPVASAGAIKEDINKRIKEAIDKNLKNTQEALIPDTNKTVGYKGTINDIKQGVFTLLNDDGSFQVTISSSAAIIKDNKPLKAELLSLKDQALVIGNMVSPDIINARRIVVFSEETNKFTKRVIIAPITKIKVNTIVIKVDNKDLEITLGKKLKLDLKTLTTSNKIFGIILSSADSNTLIQAKVL